MRKTLWRILEVMIYGFIILISLDNFCSTVRAENPALDFRGLLEHPQAGLLTGALLAMFAITVVHRLSGPIRKVERKVERWQKPAGPGAEASPMDALRLFPVHTAVFAGLVIAVVLVFWVHLGFAILLVAPAMMAAVLLSRRLGLEPPDDPAAPQNRKDI